MKNQSYILDNAAKIYPAAMTKKWNAVFRVSVYLTGRVDGDLLSQAVEELAPRFPTFYTQLHMGAFWDSLVPVSDRDIVGLDIGVPCRPFEVGSGNKPMFRVLYYGNRIAVEFFHCVTDGTGAMIYLKTLTARYLELQGYKIEKTDGVLDIFESPKASEIEDAYQSLYEKGKRVSRKEQNAYWYTPEREENYLRVSSAVINSDSLKAASRRYGCTVTAYLGGVYAYSFLKQYRKNSIKIMKNPVKISIPVNLRPYFEKDTLRNFASFVNVTVDPSQNITVADCVNTVKDEMEKLIDIDELKKGVSQNVSEEKMLITKIAPNALKKLVMKQCFKAFGEKKYTSPFSNLGKVTVSASMKKHIERFEFVIGETQNNSVYCSAVGYENSITLTLSSVTKSTEIEDIYFSALRSDNIVFTVRKLGEKENIVHSA